MITATLCYSSYFELWVTVWHTFIEDWFRKKIFWQKWAEMYIYMTIKDITFQDDHKHEGIWSFNSVGYNRGFMDVLERLIAFKKVWIYYFEFLVVSQIKSSSSGFSLENKLEARSISYESLFKTWYNFIIFLIENQQIRIHKKIC